MRSSPFKGRYDETVDRESAYERLQARALERVPEPKRAPRREPTEDPVEAAKYMGKAVLWNVGAQFGRALARGILGSLFGSSRR
jgi:hypothetical protein